MGGPLRKKPPPVRGGGSVVQDCRGFRLSKAATAAAILSKAPAGRRRQNEISSPGALPCFAGLSVSLSARPLRRADFERLGVFCAHGGKGAASRRRRPFCSSAQAFLCRAAIRGVLFDEQETAAALPCGNSSGAAARKGVHHQTANRRKRFNDRGQARHRLLRGMQAVTGIAPR